MNVPPSPQVRMHDEGAGGDFREEAARGKGLAEPRVRARSQEEAGGEAGAVTGPGVRLSTRMGPVQPRGLRQGVVTIWS